MLSNIYQVLRERGLQDSLAKAPEAWNNQADEYNQWSDLSTEEHIIWSVLYMLDHCDAEMRYALTEITDRLSEHPIYLGMTEEEELRAGGDAAEYSYLVRIGREALAKAAKVFK